MKVQSSDIQFAEVMPVTVCQERFFANAKNKVVFTRALADHTERAGTQVKQAVADADRLIVRTAIELSPTIDVVVVATDVDSADTPSSSDNHLYLFKPDMESIPTTCTTSAISSAYAWFEKLSVIHTCIDRL